MSLGALRNPLLAIFFISVPVLVVRGLVCGAGWLRGNGLGAFGMSTSSPGTGAGRAMLEGCSLQYLARIALCCCRSIACHPPLVLFRRGSGGVTFTQSGCRVPLNLIVFLPRVVALPGMGGGSGIPAPSNSLYIQAKSSITMVPASNPFPKVPKLTLSRNLRTIGHDLNLRFELYTL